MRAGIIGLLFIFFMIGCWIGNFYKFVNCDFQAPYKGEIIHAVGLVPILSIATVWIDDK